MSQDGTFSTLRMKSIATSHDPQDTEGYPHFAYEPLGMRHRLLLSEKPENNSLMLWPNLIPIHSRGIWQPFCAYKPA